MLKWLEKFFKPASDWDGSDKRQVLRVRAEFDVEVGSGHFRYMGKTIDISPRGIRVRVRGPWKASNFKEGAKGHVKHLEPGFGSDPTVKTMVRWAKKESDQQFVVGFLFDEPVERLEKTWVKSVLQKTMRNKARQERRSVRVRCNLPARLTFGETILESKLRDLSTGGAQVEVFKGIPKGTEVLIQAGPVESMEKLYLRGTVERVTQPLGTIALGVRFAAPDDKQKAVLLSYIRFFHELHKKSAL